MSANCPSRSYVKLESPAVKRRFFCVLYVWSNVSMFMSGMSGSIRSIPVLLPLSSRVK